METALSPFGEAICLFHLLFSHYAVGVNLCVIAPPVVTARVDERGAAGGYAFSFFSESADEYKKSGWWMEDGLDE